VNISTRKLREQCGIPCLRIQLLDQETKGPVSDFSDLSALGIC